MFEAMLVACLMGNPNQCITATDTRGPYLTAERCETRIMEMIKSSLEIWKESGLPFVIVHTDCKKIKSI